MSKKTPYLLAVTGQIGSGKSTFLKLVGKKYPVISSDEIVHKLLNKKEVINKITSIFSKDILESDSIVNRSRLAEIVFSNNEKRLLLEKVLHPLVEIEIFKEVNKITEVFCFIEVPLLFEINWQDKFDKSILVYTDESIIKKRLKIRGLSVEMIEKRLAAQLPLLKKVELSDYIIYNNGDLKELELMSNLFIKRLEKGVLC